MLTRAVVQEVLREQRVTLYWRALTPPVTRWGLVSRRRLGPRPGIACDQGRPRAAVPGRVRDVRVERWV